MLLSVTASEGSTRENRRRQGAVDAPLLVPRLDRPFAPGLRGRGLLRQRRGPRRATSVDFVVDKDTDVATDAEILTFLTNSVLLISRL